MLYNKSGDVMEKIYQKNELLFAIIWIVIYVVGSSIVSSLPLTTIPNLQIAIFHK